MGHVDHGKTRLLDAIRKTDVLSGEAGGITQSIGAYQVHTTHEGVERAITFIDTPGHEAFTAMRARGAKVTDIAVLVVAADDGVMPQTIEALNHAQAADVPIVVAVNKIDSDGANPAKVRQQLTEYNLVAEEYGGTTIFVDVSAKQGTNIDQLLESILLTADAALDLRAVADAPALVVSRSRPTSTAAVARWRPCWSSAERSRSATRSSPVTPTAGSAPCSTSTARTSTWRSRRVRSRCSASRPSPAPATSSSSPTRTASPGRSPRSAQAMQRNARWPRPASGSRSRTGWSRARSTRSTSSSRVTARVRSRRSRTRCSTSRSATRSSCAIIDRGVGAITQNDVNLAVASEAVIIGFNVRPAERVTDLIDREGVDVRYYSVIYQAIDEVEAALKGMLKPEYEEAQLGTAEIREVYRSSKFGNIAGCLVRSGEIRRNAKARLVRDGAVVADNLTDRVAQAVQGRRDRGARGLRVRHRPGVVQRHQGRRRHRDLRDAREGPRLTLHPPRSTAVRPYPLERPRCSSAGARSLRGSGCCTSGASTSASPEGEALARPADGRRAAHGSST